MANSNAVYVPEAPPETQIRRLVGVLDPLARLIRPKVYGVENVPDGGALLVGNHSLYAFLDLPFMLLELWKRRVSGAEGSASTGITGSRFGGICWSSAGWCGERARTFVS